MLTPSRSASLFFNKLPAELRRMVYDCCLFVGKVAPYAENKYAGKVAPYPEDKTTSSLPCVTLLRTCKVVKFEAEPVIYENTFILSTFGAIQKLFHQTLPTPTRKLLLKSAEVSLSFGDYTDNDRIELMPFRTPPVWHRQVHRLLSAQLTDRTWPRKVDLVLDHLTLDHFILDLSRSFCFSRDCACSMAARATTRFKKGFALQAPNTIDVKGWDAGRADVDVVVRDCLGIWTMRRASHEAGYADVALGSISEAEEWLLEAARKERESDGV